MSRSRHVPLETAEDAIARGTAVRRRTEIDGELLEADAEQTRPRARARGAGTPASLQRPDGEGKGQRR